MQWEMQFGKDFSCLFREERSSQSAQGPRLVGPSRSSEKYASSYHEYELACAEHLLKRVILHTKSGWKNIFVISLEKIFIFL